MIVAGAGPVGLTLAIDLGRRGVRCLLMERHPTTLPWPKMDRSNARTMEFYRRIGIVDRVRALGYPPDNPMDVFLTTRLSDPPIAVLKYPSVAERRRQIAESPNGAWLLEPYQLVSQNKLEPLLKEVAEGTPNVTVRYGCELVDFTQDETGVTVHARTVDGSEETLRAATSPAVTAAPAPSARNSASGSKAAAASASWFRSSSARIRCTSAS